MKNKRLMTLTLPFLLVAGSSVYACDDKPCEAAYIASTLQYIANGERHAEAVHSERLEYLSNFERQFEAILKERRAHARNRERRDFALYNHFHPVLPAKIEQATREVMPHKMAKNNKSTII